MSTIRKQSKCECESHDFDAIELQCPPPQKTFWVIARKKTSLLRSNKKLTNSGRWQILVGGRVAASLVGAERWNNSILFRNTVWKNKTH